MGVSGKAFERRSAVRPTRIGEIRINIIDDDQGKGSADARIGVIFDDDHVQWVDVDLLDHLTDQEKGALRGLMQSLRQRATAQILPEGK